MKQRGRRPAEEYILQINVSEGFGYVGVEYWAIYLAMVPSAGRVQISQQAFSAAKRRYPEKLRTVVQLSGKVQVKTAEEVTTNGN